ncbi:hypothetical protein LCGC14_2297070 [marine sediment metagenome]|uniref:HNH nuclease domain-containing protein n=1 Tax=marine sediment metagenome TaxID=412755 RepID=A0A0F9CQ44_9ZZZZ
MAEPITLTYDKTLYKKCIKCRAWKPRAEIEIEGGENVLKGFGDHDTSSDGLQSICFTCKNVANVASRKRNVPARIRHHTATRCLTQLGEYAPKEFTKNLEDYLGYKITALVKHLRADLKEREGPKRQLRDALNEGYHIDHIIPLFEGGSTDKENTQTLCANCHRLKTFKEQKRAGFHFTKTQL